VIDSLDVVVIHQVISIRAYWTKTQLYRFTEGTSVSLSPRLITALSSCSILCIAFFNHWIPPSLLVCLNAKEYGGTYCYGPPHGFCIQTV